MKKKSLIQWFIRLIKRDMMEYEEDAAVKEHVYQTVQNEIGQKVVSSNL